jgi:hypothetical protein
MGKNSFAEERSQCREQRSSSLGPIVVVGPQELDAGTAQKVEGLQALRGDRAGGSEIEEIESLSNRAGCLPNL